MGKYHSETDVERVLGMTIDATTKPTSAQVEKFIEETEAEIDEKALGLNYAQDEIQDVVYRESVSYREDETEVRVIPYHLPIGTVSECFVNEANVDETPDWQARKEGPADDADFIVLKAKFRNRTVGYALQFFQDAPNEGKAKIKISYTWGWDFPKEWLRKFASLKTAIKVLLHKASTEQVPSVPMFTGGEMQTWVPVAYRETIRLLKEELAEMEAQVPPDLVAARLASL